MNKINFNIQPKKLLENKYLENDKQEKLKFTLAIKLCVILVSLKILKIPEYFDDVERLFVIVIKNALFKKIGSPPLYSLLPLWAGDAKEGQCTKLLCPEFDGKSSCPIKGKY